MTTRIFETSIEVPILIFGTDRSRTPPKEILLQKVMLKIPLSIKIPDREPPIVKVFLPPPKFVIPPRRTVKRVERGGHGEITRIVEEEE